MSDSKTMWRVAMLCGAAIMVLASRTDAATVLTTPVVPTSDGEFATCLVTNIGSRPAGVTVAIFLRTGTPLTPSLDNCLPPPAMLPPGTTCEVLAPAGSDLYCRVTSRSRALRAAIAVHGTGSGNPLIMVVPATK